MVHLQRYRLIAIIELLWPSTPTRSSAGKITAIYWLLLCLKTICCEPFILEKTGMTVEEHQQKTISRYDELLRCDTGVYIMPVLQGYEPSDYVRHIRLYGKEGDWLRGRGLALGLSARNGNIRAIEEVLLAIHHARPDLRLHGFGLKSTSSQFRPRPRPTSHRRFYGLELCLQGWSEETETTGERLRSGRSASRLVHFSLTVIRGAEALTAEEMCKSIQGTGAIQGSVAGTLSRPQVSRPHAGHLRRR